MKKIRILHVAFDTEIRGYEVPAFRGAVIKKVGQDNTLFHNHIGESEFRYKYPVIQYKQINRCPAIVCVDQGVDEIHKFFEQRDWSLEISGRRLDMKISNLQMNQFTLQVWDKQWTYQISNWMCLNEQNYPKYKAMLSLVERLQFLENLLRANILAFAKGIEWTVDREIQANIINIQSEHTVAHKGKRVLAFNLSFSSNVFLPNHIGLGKSVSLGFGDVCMREPRSFAKDPHSSVGQ